jgi:5'(3')-deoxyribonucleotidase
MPDTRPVFIVDCDDCLGDLHTAWYERHNRLCRICTQPMTIERTLTWHVYEHVECGMEIYRYLVEPTLWRDMKPKRDAQRILPRIAKYMRPVVATHVTLQLIGEQAVKYRIAWVRKHFPCIDPHDIVIIENKASIRGEMILDDNPENLKNHTASRLMLDYPYNRDFSDAVRVFNWHDIELRTREYLDIGGHTWTTESSPWLPKLSSAATFLHRIWRKTFRP